MARICRARITGTGSYTPPDVMNNSDFERIVDTSDDWITSRTGIKERRIASKDITGTDMAVHAVRAALDEAGWAPEDVELLIVGTVTPDYRLPSNSCVVQEKMGLVNATTMDIAAACAGFIHGLSITSAYIESGQYEKVIVVGVEKLSSITNYKDRGTCILFGDAAGAVALEKTHEDRGVLANFIKSDGRLAKLLWIPVGGTVNTYANACKNGGIENGDDCLQMNGAEVFKHAVRQMGDASLNVLSRSGLTPDDLSLIVPHQANKRIIDAVANRLNIPQERVFQNIEMYGNTSSASVPLALDEARRGGRIKDGDNILMIAFGGGLTWGASLVRW